MDLKPNKCNALAGIIVFIIAFLILMPLNTNAGDYTKMWFLPTLIESIILGIIAYLLASVCCKACCKKCIPKKENKKVKGAK